MFHILGRAERNTHHHSTTILLLIQFNLHHLRVPEDTTLCLALLSLRRFLKVAFTETFHEMLELGIQLGTKGGVVILYLQRYHAKRSPALGLIRHAVTVTYHIIAAALARTLIGRILEAAIIIVLGTTLGGSHHLSWGGSVLQCYFLWFHNLLVV